MLDATALSTRETVTVEKYEMTEQGKVLFETLVLVDGTIVSKTSHNEALLASLLTKKEVPDAAAYHG